jgi:phosphatidate cytidylyltransferase
MHADAAVTQRILVWTAGLFVLGGALVVAAPRLGAGPPLAAELRRLFRLQLLIIAPVIAIFAIGGWLLAAALGLFALRGMVELWDLCGGRPGADAVAALIVLGLGLAALGTLSLRPDGAAILLVCYFLVESCDSFAAVGGRLWGRTPLLPRLSPRKTAEGLAAGLAVAAPVGYLLARQALGWPALRTVLFVATVLAAGFIGDMATSLLKRRHGRKDFSAVHFLHGGVLDIYDSLLLAAPVCWLFR